MQTVKFGKCSMCDKPGVGAINANASANAIVEARWEVRCEEHNPYWNPGGLTQAVDLLNRLVANTPYMDDRAGRWPDWAHALEEARAFCASLRRD